jgi:hypothetical protein
MFYLKIECIACLINRDSDPPVGGRSEMRQDQFTFCAGRSLELNPS